MSKIPTMDEMAKQLSKKALDEFYYNDKSLREWVKIIVSENAISRETVITIVEKVFMLPLETEEDIENAFEYLKREIKELPPIQPKAKVGKWIVEVWNNKEHHICSSCQYVVNYEPCYHYCPYCGAKMESEE